MPVVAADFAVGGLRAREHDAATPQFARHLEHVRGSHHVDVVAAVGVGLGLNREDRGKVDHDFGSQIPPGPAQGLGVCHVGFGEGDLALEFGGEAEIGATGRGQHLDAALEKRTHDEDAVHAKGSG